jgi:hypothetical protein
MSEKKKFKPNNEFFKCAPSKTFDKDNNTCFTLEQLKQIASYYNNENKDSQIDYKNLDIKQLLKELISKLPDTCKSQECLLKEDYIIKKKKYSVKEDDEEDYSDEEKDFDLLYNTLRPLGPTLKNKWLSSSDINQIMIQYTFKYPDYKFFGALPIDFEKIELPIDYTNKFFKILSNMYKRKIYKIGFVLNLDEHNKSGSHWVALYSNLQKGQVYFFDSYGVKPKKEIIKLMSMITHWIRIYKPNDKEYNAEKIAFTKQHVLQFTKMGKCVNNYEIDIRYNTIRHQFKNSECGVYSVNFILRLLNGNSSFDNITENITLDDKINECRKTYFRFDLVNSE